MNKKGQTLVLFIVLMPLFLMAFTLIFDSAYITLENNRLNNIAKTAIKDILENNYSEDQVHKMIKENSTDIMIKELDVGTEVKVLLRKDISSFFGQVLGYDHYELTANYVGTIKNGKLMITEKG